MMRTGRNNGIGDIIQDKLDRVQDLPASTSPAAAGCAFVTAGEACVDGGEATSSG
jgi:hypothetical protein